jgi:hypothetical protein
LGGISFFPFLGDLARYIDENSPDDKIVLTVYLDRTRAEATDAATAVPEFPGQVIS